MSSAPTIVDVAAAAGVSVRTVSRVINRSPKVGAATRDAIEQVIASLGFTPSARAQALASGRSQLIAVIQGDENAHVLGAIQRGIAEVCSDSGHELLVRPARVADPDIVQQLTGFARRSRVDGLIVLSPVSEVPGLPAALARLGVPAVALASRQLAGYPTVLVADDAQASAAVGTHLAALGHRRIALVTGPAGRASSQERAAGFTRGLADSGIVLRPEMIVEGDYGFASGMAAAARLLDGNAPPSAIFACNDLMAAGVLKAAEQRGLAVPAQLSVAGFDGTDVAAMVSPALTTVRRPMRMIAGRATRCLLAHIGQTPAAPVQDHIALELVIGNSTGPAPV
ncbi:LacI family transcriptional regulator [Croceibacterium mercuriale]|uniref:LacI family transcriptional regulator n=1 Tax=Croceibacterium mercuriale TaxID=1572751 RepID=A0A0B2BTM2_9SPHN|nr:LacI family DNA-binding transcriptional regulator [Croceibacterium mercuriale]KHL24759.1 LacI family transcriptional regulator [Croceibacterium mercuriale]